MLEEKDLTEKITLAFLTLLFFLLPVIFYLPAHDLYCTPRIWLVRVVTILVLALTLIRSIRSGKVVFRNPSISLPVLVFLLMAVISTFSSLHFYTSFFGEPVFFYGLLNILSGVVLLFLLVNIVQDETTQKWLTTSLLLGSAVVAFYALCQRFNFPFLYAYFKMAMFDPQRVDSTFGNPAFLSLYLMLVLPLASYQLLKNQATKSTRLSIKDFFLLLLVTLLIFSAIVTYSRAAWIGLAIEIVLLAVAFRLKLNPNFFIKSGFVIVVLVVLYLSSASIKTPSVSERLASITHVNAFQGRQAMWKYSVPMVGDFPLLGTGPGTFRYAFYRDYIPLNWEKVGEARLTVVEPHNYFLQLACEHGIFGLLAFLWLVISFFWFTVQNFLDGKKSDKTLFSAALAIGVFGFLVVAATTMQEITNLVFFWVVLGMALRSGKMFKETTYERKLPATGKAIWSTVVVLMATLLFFFSSQYALADVYYESGARIMRSEAYQYLYDATIDLRTSIRYFPYNSEIYRELGNIYLDAFKRTGQPDYFRPAMDSFEQAVKVNPYDYEADSSLGETYLLASRALGQSELIEKSRQTYLRLLNTRFDQPFSHYMLGRIYIEQGQNGLAVDEWKASARLDPKYSAPYLGLATIYLKKGDVNTALKMYRAALKADPDNPAVKELGKQLNP